MKRVGTVLWFISGMLILGYILSSVLWEPFAKRFCLSQAHRYGISIEHVRMPKYQECEVLAEDGRWVGFGTWVEYWNVKPND